jgi:hypothetical protein
LSHGTLRRGCSFITALLLTLNVRAAQPARETATPLPSNVRGALVKSEGKLTPDVRGAYLDWSENLVLAQLATKRQEIPQDCLDEVHRDPNLRDAMFAAVYPPDPDILQNYARLRKALGPAFLQRYRSLVIGVAVARRNSSVAPADEHDFYPAGAATEPAGDDDTPEPSDALSRSVADFLKAQNLTALELYKDQAKRGELLDFLRKRGVVDRKQIDALQQNKPLGRALKRAMIILGQRPAAREAKPDEVTWLKYLASTYESNADTPRKHNGKGEMDWPLFPMDKAPWPLLMPLARPLPLGEARYIWEKFNGQHGGDRYHSYGPYKKYDGQILKELKPSPWHWDAWPDRIVHGGVCTVMCTITIDLHSALCMPSVHAGQPHHANLITYHATQEGWTATVDQAYAGGPNVTSAAWLFHDEPKMLRLDQKKVGAEYHLGLAQAMNVGLRQWIDTRIAVCVYNALPTEQKQSIGPKLLAQATHENPYNPAPWYLLASQTQDVNDGLPLAQAAQAHAGDATKKKHLDPAAEYWRVLTEFLTREAVLKHPMPKDDASARRVYQFLKAGVHGISADEQAPFVQRFGS